MRANRTGRRKYQGSIVVLGKRFHRFLRDESGGYTIWSLLWFSLYVAMGGLAVDMTDAYRNQTLLQSTADASALAAVMSLPDQADGLAQALVYAGDNMAPAINGNVLKAGEVIFGNWSFATRTFTPGTTAPDAARVITRRDSANSNPLATNFLRIIGLQQWNISVEAIATKYIPECLGYHNVLLAGNKIDITSNNGFSETCMHAQNVEVDPGPDYAIDLGNNNVFGDDVEVSMSNLDDLNGRPNVCPNNPGLCDPGTLVEGDMWPKTVNLIDAIITGLNSADPEYVMDALYQTDEITLNTINPTVVVIDQNFAGPYEPYTVYIGNCANDNNLLSLPGGVQIDKVVIVTNCKIKGESGVMLSNVILASSSTGNGANPYDQHSIDFPSNLQIGSYEEFCNNGGAGQVHMYSMASAKVAAGPDVYGLRAVVVGDFEFSANNDVYGISVEAGNNITATANGQFIYCDGGVIDAPIASQYRLVL